MSARRQFLRARTFGPALALVLGACPSDDDLAIMTSATEGPATSTGSTSTSTGSSPMTTLLPPATETTDPTSTGGTTDLEDTTSTSTSTSTTATVSTTENSTTDSDTCGDGDLDPGEGCDLGSDNDNNGACTKLCQLPECGDGLEQPGEACDLGPANHPNEYNGCTPECALGPHCGDGHTDVPDEACDPTDPNLADPAFCFKCQWSAKVVFVSSVTFTGDIGGLSGADAECQSLAGAAGLTKNGQVFRAWLSDGVTSAAQRLTHPDDSLILVDGTLVASGWTDLTDGGLAHPIDLDEHGQPVAAPDYAWTGTAWNGGSKDPLKSCAGWTSSIITEKGLRGWAAQDTIEWTEAINFGEAACHKSGHIYCLQQ